MPVVDSKPLWSTQWDAVFKKKWFTLKKIHIKSDFQAMNIKNICNGINSWSDLSKW